MSLAHVRMIDSTYTRGFVMSLIPVDLHSTSGTELLFWTSALVAMTSRAVVTLGGAAISRCVDIRRWRLAAVRPGWPVSRGRLTLGAASDSVVDKRHRSR